MFITAKHRNLTPVIIKLFQTCGGRYPTFSVAARARVACAAAAQARRYTHTRGRAGPLLAPTRYPLQFRAPFRGCTTVEQLPEGKAVPCPGDPKLVEALGSAQVLGVLKFRNLV